MDISSQADPSIYPKLREHALQLRLPDLPNGAIHAVLMDWPLTEGTMTALAAADGTASIYLSSGGGFIGGGQQYPEIRQAALDSVCIASELLVYFQPTERYDLPPAGEILFYITTNEGVRVSGAAEDHLKAQISPLCELADTMQQITSAYRLSQQQTAT